MRTRRDYQIACPACRASAGRPCRSKEGLRLPGVHFQRGAALRSAYFAALKSLYTPLAPQARNLER